MKRLADAGPNAEQIRYWNEQGGPRWVAHADRIDAHIGPLGRLALERAGIEPGQRVLDVGCGCGQTSLELAGRVGPAGRVTGIDLSADMLAVAARRAGEAAWRTCASRSPTPRPRRWRRGASSASSPASG